MSATTRQIDAAHHELAIELHGKPCESILRNDHPHAATVCNNHTQAIWTDRGCSVAVFTADTIADAQ